MCRASVGGMSQREIARGPADIPNRRLIASLAALAGVSATGGAAALFVWRAGSSFLPRSLIEHTPFKTFLIPSLLLGFMVGGTSLACAILVWRRSRAAVDAAVLAGGALTVWILAEMAMMRHVHWLHVTYGSLGVGILVHGAYAALRSKAPRPRWVLLVTMAETTGYMVPACTGILSARAGFDGPSMVVLLTAAGFLEGFALGVGQAWAIPLPVRKMRYALLTALGAGLVWLSVMLLISLVESKSVPFAFASVAGFMTVLVGLLAIGSSQWLELRHHVEVAHRWIPWTAAAWALALPFSFAPGPFVDESTPLAAHIVLWGCGGLLMAFVMAQTTWQGVDRLVAASPGAQFVPSGSLEMAGRMLS